MKNTENNLPNVNNILDVRQKFNSKELIENISSLIKSGDVNPLEGWTILKRMQTVAEKVMEDDEIKKMAFSELEKFQGELKGGKKSVDIYSASISISAVHTYYDFSGCNHTVLNALYDIKAQFEASIKTIEEQVKTIPSNENKVAVLGLEAEGQEMVMERMPKLIWEDEFSTERVIAPRKVQKIGIRFNHV